MASKKLTDMMNDAIAREIAVSIQYMWQHIMVKGVESETVGTIFRQIALVEMTHAEFIAERLDYLGGTPTTKPTRIDVGGYNAKKMLGIDVSLEEDAIKLYKQLIKLADKEGDSTTRKLFEQILADEENHHNTFKTLLGK